MPRLLRTSVMVQDIREEPNGLVIPDDFKQTSGVKRTKGQHNMYRFVAQGTNSRDSYKLGVSSDLAFLLSIH